MIKALYIESWPTMDRVSAVELLEELNPLARDGSKNIVIPLSEGHKMIKDSFITKNYFITFVKIDDPNTFLAMSKIYDVIQLSVPNFIKVLNIGTSLIVATPKHNDSYENACYSVMIDELIRFTAYCLKRTGDEIMSSIMLKEYIEMFVSYGKD